MIQAPQGGLNHEQSLLAVGGADGASEAFFPESHGKPRVDDRRVLSGIIFINRNGLRCRDAPMEYGPAKTLYNRWKRWSENRVFARIMIEVSRRTPCVRVSLHKYLKAHRTASGLRVSSEDQKTVRWTVFPTIGGRTGWLRTWAAKLARRRGAKRAMVALVRRIAVILHRMWKDDIDFRFDIPVLHAG